MPIHNSTVENVGEASGVGSAGVGSAGVGSAGVGSAGVGSAGAAASETDSSTEQENAEIWYLGYPSTENDTNGVITTFQTEWAELYSLTESEAEDGEILFDVTDLSPILNAETVYTNQEIVGICPLKISIIEDTVESHMNMSWSFNDSSRPTFILDSSDGDANIYEINNEEVSHFLETYQPEVSFGVNYNSMIGSIALEIQASLANARQRVYDFNKYNKPLLTDLEITPLQEATEDTPAVTSTTAPTSASTTGTGY